MRSPHDLKLKYVRPGGGGDVGRGHGGLGAAVVVEGGGRGGAVTLLVAGDHLGRGGAVTLQVIGDGPSEAGRQVRALVVRPELGRADRV